MNGITRRILMMLEEQGITPDNADITINLDDPDHPVVTVRPFAPMESIQVTGVLHFENEEADNEAPTVPE